MLNQNLTAPRFLSQLGGDFINVTVKAGQGRRIPGNKLHDSLVKAKKDKSGVSKYYTANLFLGLDRKSGSLVYFNTDSIVG